MSLRIIRVLFTSLFMLICGNANAIATGDSIAISKGMEMSLGVSGQLDATKKLGTLDNGIEVWILTVRGNVNRLPYLAYVLPNGSIMIGHMFTKEGKAVTIQYARKFQGAMDHKILKLDDALHLHFGSGDDDFHQVVVLWTHGDGHDLAVEIDKIVRETPEFKDIPFDVYIKAYGDATKPSPFAVALQTKDKSTLEKNFFLEKSEYLQWLEANMSAATKAEIMRAKQIIKDGNVIAKQFNIPDVRNAIQFQVRIMNVEGRLQKDIVAFMLNTYPGKDYTK